MKKEQEKESGSVSRPASGPQRPAEPVASGFFVGSNRAEKCGSVKGPWRQAVGRGCQIFPALSHSLRCQDRVVTVSCLQQGKQSARLCEITNGFNL